MAQSPSSSNTGVEGVISLSPSHGGPARAGVSNSVPLANTGFAVRKGEETVATFTTDANGHFRVTVPPGHYTVQSTPPATVMSFRWRFDVDVKEGEVTQVRWTADSGMR